MSFHAPIAVKMMPVANTGFISGTRIVNKYREYPHPSMAAASSSSRETDLIYPTNIRKAMPVPVVFSKIKPKLGIVKSQAINESKLRNQPDSGDTWISEKHFFSIVKFPLYA